MTVTACCHASRANGDSRQRKDSSFYYHGLVVVRRSFPLLLRDTLKTASVLGCRNALASNYCRKVVSLASHPHHDGMRRRVIALPQETRNASGVPFTHSRVGMMTQQKQLRGMFVGLTLAYLRKNRIRNKGVCFPYTFPYTSRPAGRRRYGTAANVTNYYAICHDMCC